MSLSPIEIAKAFNAPFFQEVSSNATADQMLQIMSQKKVFYGVRQDQELMNRGVSRQSVSTLTAAERSPTAQSDADGDHDSDRADTNEGQSVDRADAGEDPRRDAGDAEEHFLAPSSRSEGKAPSVHASQQLLYDGENGAGRSMRLEIMDSLHARRPRKGEVYM